MSCEIHTVGTVSVVVLEAEMGIPQAAAFHQAVVPLAASGATVRVDARAVRSVHSSIMQILHALSRAVPEFGIADASDEFRAAEARGGLTFARGHIPVAPDRPAEPIEVPHA